MECELKCADGAHADAVIAASPTAERAEAVARLAKAFADPNRVSIAAALSVGGELCGCDLSELLRLPQNLISHHLGILRTVGATTSRRNGKLVMHRLSAEGSDSFAALMNATGHVNSQMAAIPAVAR